MQPWTEDPQLPTDAIGPLRGAAVGQNALTDMQSVAAAAVAYLDQGPKYLAPELAARMRFIGEDNLSNSSAVRNLMNMAPNCYVYHNSKSGLEKLLPGVTTHVLGPPTLQQTDTIKKQRSRDRDEFWHFQAFHVARALGPDGEGVPAFPKYVAAKGGRLPMSSRWLAQRIRGAKGEQIFELVRSLDKQLNNTSVILLFEAGGKKFLFPGDAQIENWEYALSQPDVVALLADVDVYKVGHHGSLNATPKTMWAQFGKKGKASKKDRLTSILSTREGKHGHEEDGTEVPRMTLLKELATHSHLHSTHQMAPDELCKTIMIPF